MEILKDYESSVQFVVPATLTTANYIVKKNNVRVGGVNTVTPENGLVEVNIPYAAVQEDGQVVVELTFYYGSDRYEKKETLEVVTPYLPLHEIAKIAETQDEEEIATIESAVRHIINAHCGQSFGKFTGTIAVTGSGDSNLRMPRRLISLANINNNIFLNQNLIIRGGGWFLRTRAPYGPPSIRADFDGWHYTPNSGVITAPPFKEYVSFVKNAEYMIDGVWGWESVPEGVKEAAKLLVNDYLCSDSLYRDRFLTSMTAADWRIQFHEGAFSNTGNVRANQLLSEFVLRRGWVVI